jgi:repressor LexA
MTRVIYMMPKRTHLSWDPRLEPLDLETEPGIEVPLLGYVSAGRPVETPEEQETIRVPSHMTRKASYALRVRGHSMIDDQIQDGDIIVIEQRQTAANGETVVALINGHQVTLKRFYVEAAGVRLQPANPEMAPLYLRHEEIEILGIVTGVVRMTRTDNFRVTLMHRNVVCLRAGYTTRRKIIWSNYLALAEEEHGDSGTYTPIGIQFAPTANGPALPTPLYLERG